LRTEARPEGTAKRREGKPVFHSSTFLVFVTRRGEERGTEEKKRLLAVLAHAPEERKGEKKKKGSFGDTCTPAFPSIRT